MKPLTLRAHAARLARVRAALAAEFDDPPDLPRLAALAGLSPAQLERVFLRAYGESVRACGRRLRLERAARALRTSRRPILDLALEAGFGSHEAFTRAFRRRFGHTPDAFRNLPRAPALPRRRRELWQTALAVGLRRHVERE